MIFDFRFSYFRTLHALRLFFFGVIFLALLLVVAAFPATVSAQALTFDADTTLNFSGSGLSLTVKNGSTADSLTVNASDASVILGAGQTFTIENTNGTHITNSRSGSVTSCSGDTIQVRFDTAGSHTFNPETTRANCPGGGVNPAIFQPPKTPEPSAENPEGGFRLKINNDAAVTDSRDVTLILFGGSDTKNIAVSEREDFSGIGQEPYARTRQLQLSAGDGEKTVYVRFYNPYGRYVQVLNTIELRTVQLPPPPKPEETITPSREITAEDIQEIQSTATDFATGNLATIRALTASTESQASEQQARAKVGAGASDAVVGFVAYGTPATRTLGLGERAGVLRSYEAAFGNFPATKEEWEDALKIAAGRFPGKKNIAREQETEKSFEKVYLRAPDRDNANDNAAVVVMTYGLRPAKRNLESERLAIGFFGAIFGHVPENPGEWDIVRAIAYSGATR